MRPLTILSFRRFSENVRFALILLVLTTMSCGRLPKLGEPAISPERQLYENCEEIPYLSGKWRFVHSIEAVMPGGKRGTLIGICLISSETGTIHSVIMTIEGFVLFDARYDGELLVSRSIPPFDTPGFARGQMEDMKLIFFRPEGKPIRTGILENGSPACRYENSDGMTVDVIIRPDNSWEIRKYGRNAKLVRTVRAFRGQAADQKWVPPERLELTAHGMMGYSLILKLMQAEN